MDSSLVNPPRIGSTQPVLNDRLAEWVAHLPYDAMPAQTVVCAKRLIIDALAVAWAGSRAIGLEPVHRLVVDQGGNVTQQFTAALQAIEGKALGCTYAIPAPNPVGQAINYEKVNVQVTLTGALPVQEGYVASPADCGATGGWYYDAPAQPNKILLCPVTCTAVTGDPKAKVVIVEYSD